MEQNANPHQEKDRTPTNSCSLCGQLYHGFTFKGGFICEDCLDSIKSQEPPSSVREKDT